MIFLLDNDQKLSLRTLLQLESDNEDETFRLIENNMSESHYEFGSSKRIIAEEITKLVDLKKGLDKQIKIIKRLNPNMRFRLGDIVSFGLATQDPKNNDCVSHEPMDICKTLELISHSCNSVANDFKNGYKKHASKAIDDLIDYWELYVKEPIPMKFSDTTKFIQL